MATATKINSSREARRRRIVERGSDRFALITGRMSPSSPSAATFSPSDPSSPFGICQGEDKGYATSLSNHYSDNEIGKCNIDVVPSALKGERCVEASKEPVLDLSFKDQSSQVSTTSRKTNHSASEAEHHLKLQTFHYKFYTLNQIFKAVSASKTDRIYCALAAGMLVVSSYIGLPILGNNIIRSVIFFRPLYLVLLTNISIVVSQLLDEKQRVSQRTEQQANRTPSTGGGGLADQLGDALEIGLLLKKIMGALFMDCSVYSVVVLCGLSLSKRLGW